MGVPPEGVLSELTGKKANKSIHPCEKNGTGQACNRFLYCIFRTETSENRLVSDFFCGKLNFCKFIRVLFLVIFLTYSKRLKCLN